MNITYQVQHWLPGRVIRIDGNQVIRREPATPCPDVLTQEEACRFLQLDLLKDPLQSLCRLRSEGQLEGFNLSKRVMFTLTDLLVFVDRRKEENTA